MNQMKVSLAKINNLFILYNSLSKSVNELLTSLLNNNIFVKIQFLDTLIVFFCLFKLFGVVISRI